MEKDSENSKHKMPSWINTLEPISKFIGTYGLAVFLVVYYAVWLYPDSFKERGAWITKIEELRRSINPEDKPLSTSQAESILDYVTDLYFLNVQSELPFNTFSYSTPGGGVVGGGTTFYQGSGSIYTDYANRPINCIDIYGPGFSFYIDKDKDLDEEIQRVVTLLKDSAMISARETVVSTYEPLMNRALDNALKSSSRLRLFNFSNATLYETWTSIVADNEQDFKTELLKSFEESQIYFQYNALNQVIRQRTNHSSDELQTPEYERPNQVLNRYRKKMKTQWLGIIKRSHETISPPDDASTDCVGAALESGQS